MDVDPSETTGAQRRVAVLESGVAPNLRYDLPASIVVFLVALPLCLGIALASGAPLMAGLITGILGGLVVSLLSGSSLAVSGPAAGLAVVVLEGIDELGGYETFLLAVIIGGLVQLVLGAARAGVFGYYIPSTVIKGLLAAIGVILILKQIPHALGFDGDPEGDLDFFQPDGRNTLSEIPYALSHFSLGAILIALVGLAVLIAWSSVPALERLRWLPGPLVVVVLGVVINALFGRLAPGVALEGDFLVELPEVGVTSTVQAAWGAPSFFGALFDPSFWRQSMAQSEPVLRFPNFGAITDAAVWKTGLVVGLIASVETLLCVEAMDKRGVDQWIPFVVTLMAILFTDLLIGVSIGIATGFGFILFANLQAPYAIHHREEYDEETGGVVQHHVKSQLGEAPGVKKVRSPVQVDDAGEIIREFDDHDAARSVAHRQGDEVLVDERPDRPG